MTQSAMASRVLITEVCDSIVTCCYSQLLRLLRFLTIEYSLQALRLNCVQHTCKQFPEHRQSHHVLSQQGAPSSLPDDIALLPATRLSLGASPAILARVHARSPRRARFCTAPSLSLQTESIPTTWAQRANRDSKRMHRRRRNEQTQAPKRGRNNKAQTQAAAREYSTSKHERQKAAETARRRQGTHSAASSCSGTSRPGQCQARPAAAKMGRN